MNWHMVSELLAQYGASESPLKPRTIELSDRALVAQWGSFRPLPKLGDPPCLMGTH
jgi:hypothetical protein